MAFEQPDTADIDDAELPAPSNVDLLGVRGPLSSQSAAPPKIPATFDLRSLIAQTTFQRAASNLVLLAFAVVLVVLWVLSELFWNVTRGSPYPLAAHLVLGLFFLGPAAGLSWKAWWSRTSNFPVAVSVTDQGFTLHFQGREDRTSRWGDSRT